MRNLFSYVMGILAFAIAFYGARELVLTIKEDVLAQAEVICEKTRSGMPATIDLVKESMVSDFCAKRSQPAVQKEYRFMQSNGITIRMSTSEKHSLMDPYSVAINAADLQHCA